jgi:hypothetical protein
MPETTISLPDGRPANTGRVVVYYDVATGANPAESTHVDNIYFDLSDRNSEFPNGRDLRLGTKLLVGNFNRDFETTNNPPLFPSGQKAYRRCDDLVIGSGYGPSFVLFGSRAVDNGIMSTKGGLNYSGPKSYLENQESCVPQSGSCQAVMFHFVASNGTSVTTPLGTAMTSGDYDGDGYEDLALSSDASHGVWVMRGSEYGLITPVTDITNYGISGHDGPGKYNLPYVSPTASALGFPNGVASLNGKKFYPNATDGTAPGWADGTADGTFGGFGAALGTLKGAYYDQLSNRIRDVLLIGNPAVANTRSAQGANFGSGRVFACIPRTASAPTNFSDDPGLNFQWDCNHTINPPARYGTSPFTNITTSINFGASMSNAINPLRYRWDNFPVPSGCTLTSSVTPEPDFGNCSATDSNLGIPGGVVIGAPGSNQAFVYYGVAGYNGTSATRLTAGSNRNTYLNKFIFPDLTMSNAGTLPTMVTAGSATEGTAYEVKKNDPCTGTSGTNEDCFVQLLTPASNASGYFGTAVAALRGSGISDSTTSPKDSLIAVAAPYKGAIVGTDSFSNVGSVQIFMQSSHNTNDSIDIGTSPTIKRFATGFSNTLSYNIDYDGTMNDQVKFGLGGMAAGAFFAGNDTEYNKNSDLVIGAPGHVRYTSVTSNGNTSSVSVYDNGAAVVMFSNNGNFKPFTLAASIAPSPPASPWHIIESVTIGQEANTRFHEAISIGDMDQDGIGDVAVRIAKGNNRNITRIYSGRGCADPTQTYCTSSVKKNNGEYTDLSVSGDSSAGYRFVPTGRVTGGTLGAYFITADSASYLYFAGTNGINLGIPSNVSSPGSPRKFTTPISRVSGTTLATGAVYMSFNNNSFYNYEGVSLTSTIDAYTPFASGDFNGDGVTDFAFAQADSAVEAAGITDNRTGTLPAGQSPCSGGKCLTTSAGAGRVFVFYGGHSSGFQVQPDSLGYYPVQASYTGNDQGTYGFVSLSADAPAANNVMGQPCETNGSACKKIQIIGEPSTTAFGRTLAAIPMGTCTFNGKNVPVSGLAVRAQKSSDSFVYVYKPKCLLGTSDFSGLGVVSGNPDGHFMRLQASDFGIGVSSTGFGVSMAGISASVGTSSIMNPSVNLLSHIIIADSAGKIAVIPVGIESNGSVTTLDHKQTVYTAGGGKVQGPATGTQFFDRGGRSMDYSLSTFTNGTAIANQFFGSGMSKVGDLNGDGYQDIGINIAGLTRKEVNANYSQQGGVLILFGGASGFQTHISGTSTLMEPSQAADCYVKPVGQALVNYCNPTLLFAPQPASSVRAGKYEYTFLSPFSVVQTGLKDGLGVCQVGSANECLGSFLLGVPGRDSVETQVGSTSILNGGAFYVVP